jgi:hypothetical protein
VSELPAMFDNPDLLKMIFGRLTLADLPFHEPYWS